MTRSLAPILVWFRKDLRLNNNAVLAAAAAAQAPVIGVFVWGENDHNPWPPGAASRAWLAASLESLRADFNKHNAQLYIVAGSAPQVLPQLVRHFKAQAVYAQWREEPFEREQEHLLAKALQDIECPLRLYNNHLLGHPDQLLTLQHKPYQVFTPFYNRMRQQAVIAPSITTSTGPLPTLLPEFLNAGPLPAELYDPAIGDKISPQKSWASRVLSHWPDISEHGAVAMIRSFLGQQAQWPYHVHRDFPAQHASTQHGSTSQLSPYLAWGQCSVQALAAMPLPEAWLRQLYWREFAHYILWHFPHTANEPLNPKFEHFPWQTDPILKRAWQQGRTGIPFVDAGMRQLWQTGWMHNRVRMVAGSFWVKQGLGHWLDGARWFWDTLVDADLANNTMGWQWVAGCGADAAPYFRIFNPLLQAKKFDADGHYNQAWLSTTAEESLNLIDALPQLRHRAMQAYYDCSKAGL